MIRFGTKQRRRFRITTTNEAEAAKRDRALIELGAAIGKAKIDPEQGARLLEDVGAGAIEKARKGLALLVKNAKAFEIEGKAKAGTIVTMSDLGKAWTTGELAAKYPDHVKLKRTADKDAQRLVELNKTIGARPVKSFTLADAELAMAALPKAAKASATRRQYAQILAKLCHLAVYPLKLIAASPLPRGFLPKVKRTKATAWLYPIEESKLLACVNVPLERRVLYGFLAREGLRCGEALRLAWSDLDLTRGVVRLDKNKTDDPRAWAMAPGVAAALERLHKIGGATGAVFNVLNADRLAEAFRADLELARVDRPELFERSKTRQPIRVHDLRATFVTLALATGRSETWVADRTGHRSSVMIANYRRGARTAAELELGELAPLDVALAWVYTPTANAGQYGAANPHPERLAHRLERQLEQ